MKLFKQLKKTENLFISIFPLSNYLMRKVKECKTEKTES